MSWMEARLLNKGWVGVLFVVQLPTGYYDIATLLCSPENGLYWESDRSGGVEPILAAPIYAPDGSGTVEADRILYGGE